MLQLVKKENLSTEDIDRLINFAKEAGGIDYAYQTMKRLRDEAGQILAPHAPNDTVKEFMEIFDYVIERKL
jgi:octaprenyl-diphosphate synthase